MSNSQNLASETYNRDELDLEVVAQALWAGKWLIAAVTVAVSVVTLVVVLFLPNVYRAEALLAPSAKDGAGGLSALAAQYGGLASLAGISLGDGQADKTALGLEIIKSRKFISEFVERRGILVPLMAARSWDRKTGVLRIDTDDFDTESNKWVREVRPPRTSVPSAQEAYETFVKILSVGQDKKTGFVTIAIEHYSPELAKQWVDWLVHDINATIMRQDVAEAEQAIEYLNAQIANTSVADLRSVFFSLIEEQTKTVMLAKVSDEYLLKTLDPAVVPEKKYRPSRLLVVAIAALLGFVFAFVGVLTSAALQHSRTGHIRAANLPASG